MHAKEYGIAIAMAFMAMLCLAVTAGPAKASISCTLSVSDAAFGNIATSTNQTYSTSQLFSTSCTGGSANEALRLCAEEFNTTAGGTASSSYYIANGSNNILFNLYTNSTHTSQLKLGNAIGTTFTLSSSGTGSASFTMYDMILSGQTTAPSGYYSANETFVVFLGDQSSLPASCIGSDLLSWNPTPLVSATNQSSCTVTGGTLNFGSVSVLTANVDQSTTIAPTCSVGAPYTVALDGGQNGGTSATNRKMVSGGQSITYGLYTDAARSQGWYGASVSGTGTGSAQSITVYGRVPPQTTPSPATYTDTVVITVTY